MYEMKVATQFGNERQMKHYLTELLTVRCVLLHCSTWLRHMGLITVASLTKALCVCQQYNNTDCS